MLFTNELLDKARTPIDQATSNHVGEVTGVLALSSGSLLECTTTLKKSQLQALSGMTLPTFPAEISGVEMIPDCV